MPRSTGTYTPPASSWNPAVVSAPATAADWTTLLADISSALTQSVSADGQTAITSDISLSSHKLTNVSNGTLVTDAATLGQVQAQQYKWLTGVSGVDTIVASLTTPTLTAYVTGAEYQFIVAGANTGAVTLNINGLGAKAVTKNGATALAANDLPASGIARVTYDGTRFQVVVVNLTLPVSSDTVAGIVELATSAETITGTDTTRATTPAGVAAVLPKQIQPIATPTLNANAMTIPSVAFSLEFRNATLGNGGTTLISGSPADLVIPAGATLGTVNAVQSSIVDIVINNAGTLERAVVNMAGGNALSEVGLISTTTISVGATSANVIYSNTGRSNVPYRVVGQYNSTQATAGQWATAPSLVQGAGGQALTTMSSLGYGQTWQTFNTTTRVPGTTYYNTTGKPIIFNYSATSGGANGIASFIVNGVTVMAPGWGSSVSSGISASIVIPSGASYSYTQGGYTTSVVIAELR